MENKITTCWGEQSSALMDRLSRLRLVVFDVDGTLTDGGIYLDNKDGEMKRFMTRDGLGIAQLQCHGVRCAIITGRNAPVVSRRMQELKVDLVLQGVADKSAALSGLMEKLGCKTEEVAAMGDDLNDLPMFERAGLCACPADAHPYICNICDVVLTQKGGHGAAREFADLILIAQGKLNLQGGPL